MKKQRPLTEEEVLMLALLTYWFWPEVKKTFNWFCKMLPKAFYGIGWLYGRYFAAITHMNYDKYIK